MHRVLPVLIALTLPAAAAAAADTVVGTALDRITPAGISQTIERLAGFGTRHTLSETGSARRGIGAARRWIAAELERCNRARGGRLVVSLASHVEPAGRRIDRDTEIVNVVATLPGLDAASRERVFIVSGHYDSRASDVMDARAEAPGANDDASGTAAVMAMACAMADQPTEATLVFLAVAGEEQGLLGADRYARDAAAAGTRIEGIITLDIIGSPLGDDGVRRDREVRLFVDGLSPLLKTLLDGQRNRPADDPATGQARSALQRIARGGSPHDAPTEQFARALTRAAARHQPDFTLRWVARRDRVLRGGDHLPFLDRGFAAVRMSEPREDYRHQHQDLREEAGHRWGDRIEHVDMDYVARVTRVTLAGLASLARAPAPPDGVRIDTVTLSNDTTLSWRPVTAPDLAGYRVVWRDTTATTWQHQRDVGRATTATLKAVSRDDMVFAVIAVDRDGNESSAMPPDFP